MYSSNPLLDELNGVVTDKRFSMGDSGGSHTPTTPQMDATGPKTPSPLSRRIVNDAIERGTVAVELAKARMDLSP